MQPDHTLSHHLKKVRKNILDLVSLSKAAGCDYKWVCTVYVHVFACACLHALPMIICLSSLMFSYMLPLYIK